MLSHINEHRDAHNKVIFSGTSDLVDDADCAYTLDIITEDSFKIRTVKFENFKNCGDITNKEVYKYDAADDTRDGDRLESVDIVPDEDRKQAERAVQRIEKLKMNEDVRRF